MLNTMDPRAYTRTGLQEMIDECLAGRRTDQLSQHELDHYYDLTEAQTHLEKVALCRVELARAGHPGITIGDL